MNGSQALNPRSWVEAPKIYCGNQVFASFSGYPILTLITNLYNFLKSKVSRSSGITLECWCCWKG